MNPRARGAAVLACVLLLSPLHSARADQVIKRDGDDTRAFLDIASVKHEHDRLDDGRMRIRHTISMHDPWRSRVLRNLCQGIYINIDDWGEPYIYIYWDDKLRAKMGRRQLATWRPDERTVAFRVRPRLLGGDDRSYRWHTRTLSTEKPRCEGGDRAWEDYAPASDRWIRHDFG